MGEIVCIDSADGTLVLGESTDLSDWAYSAGERPVEVAVPEHVFDTLAPAVEGGHELWNAALYLKRPGQTGDVEVRRITRGADGRYVSSELVEPITQLGQVVKWNPKLLVLQAAVETVAVALGEIRDAVGDVAEDVDELLRSARAAQLGEIYARARMLRRMIDRVAGGDALTRTDWESVQHLGPDLESGAEQLRRHLQGYLRDAYTLGGASAQERADYLQRLATRSRVGDLLKLLVVAQSALYDYQRLRLVRVQDTEPEHLEQTMADVRAILDENLVLDDAVAAGLLQILNEVGVLSPGEGWKVPVRRKLDKYRGLVADEVVAFLDARQEQASDWELAANPGLKEAVEFHRRKMVGMGNKAREMTARSLKQLSEKIEPSSGS